MAKEVIIEALAATYVIGMVGVLLFNVALGDITIHLSIKRAVLWPIWLVTGWPADKRIGQDR